MQTKMHTCPSLIKMEKRFLKNLVIDLLFLSSSHDARFFNSGKSIKFANYLPSNSAPHDPRCFWHRCFSVCSRIGQRHRVQQVDITRIGRGEKATCLRLPERPAHQVSPPLGTRRLAGARYQLDIELEQAGVVGEITERYREN